MSDGFDILAGLSAEPHVLHARAVTRRRKSRATVSVRTPVYKALKAEADNRYSNASAVTEALMVLWLRGDVDGEKLSEALDKAPVSKAEYQGYYEWMLGE